MLSRGERAEVAHFVYAMLADIHHRKTHDHGSFDHLCVLNVGGTEVDVFTHSPVGRVIDRFGNGGP